MVLKISGTPRSDSARYPTLLWLITNAATLGTQSRILADEAQASGELGIAAISWWEIGMVADKGRITLTQEPVSLRDSLLYSGLVEVPLGGHTAIVSAALPDFHGNPADRIITATALVQGCTLLTADQKILAWVGKLLRQDARQ